MNDDAGLNHIPLISVIVPVYNTEKYLAQCVDSLLCQSFADMEILLVNDGSTDGCPALCDAYARADQRVKVIHQRNGGYGRACNNGIKAARGEFFCIAESDDYVEPDMLSRLYETAKAHDLDVARCHYYRYNSQENTNERIDLSHVPHNITCTPRDVLSIFIQAPAIWSMLYRKSFILENGISFMETPGASFQDSSFTFKVLAAADRFMLIDDTLIHYRIDNENSSSASKDKIYFVCNEFKEIERFIEERHLGEKLMPIIPKIKFPTYMWNYQRLTKKNRWSFLGLFSRQMRKHITERMVKRELYSSRELIKIYFIAFFYPLFFLADEFLIAI